MKREMVGEMFVLRSRARRPMNLTTSAAWRSSSPRALGERRTQNWRASRRLPARCSGGCRLAGAPPRSVGVTVTDIVSNSATTSTVWRGGLCRLACHVWSTEHRHRLPSQFVQHTVTLPRCVSSFYRIRSDRGTVCQTQCRVLPLRRGDSSVRRREPALGASHRASRGLRLEPSNNVGRTRQTQAHTNDFEQNFDSVPKNHPLGCHTIF